MSSDPAPVDSPAAEDAAEPMPSAAADLVSASVWFVIGVAILIASWRMDRLASQGVPGFAAPGLVPGILGGLIVITSLAIALRSLLRGVALRERVYVSIAGAGRTLVTLGICLVFAIALVGHGLPFWLAAFAYLVVHIMTLEWASAKLSQGRLRSLMRAAIIAGVASAAVTIIFEQVFLVRLP